MMPNCDWNACRKPVLEGTNRVVVPTEVCGDLHYHAECHAALQAQLKRLLERISWGIR